jgi:DNA polymerase V
MDDIKRGGFRFGSGRKTGSGYFGEKTKVIRVPASRVVEIKKYIKSRYQTGSTDALMSAHLTPKKSYLNLFDYKVPAGFPSPADDHIEKALDLNEYLVAKKETTFFVKIKGDSMIDASIHDGDIVIVDRSKQAKIGDIVLASVDGEFTIKTLAKHLSQPRLLPANEKFQPIVVNENMQFEIWGVITGAVRKF